MVSDSAVDRLSMQDVATGLPTKSAKIRALDGEGYSRSKIAKFLDIKYQHVRNVLVSAKPKPEPVPETVWLKLGGEGRVVLPAAYRRALGLKNGDHVQVRLEDDEIRVVSRATAIRRVQDLVARHSKDDKSWVDELIAERRREAAREEAGE